MLLHHHWNFLNQDLFVWWHNRENFHDVLAYLLIMRISLEPQIRALMALNANNSERQRLSILMAKMRRLYQYFNREGWISIDTDFYCHIYTYLEKLKLFN